MKTEQRRQLQILKKRAAEMGYQGSFDGVSAVNALDNVTDAIIRQAGRLPVAHATFEGADTAARERALKALKIKAAEMGHGQCSKREAIPRTRLTLPVTSWWLK